MSADAMQVVPTLYDVNDDGTLPAMPDVSEMPESVALNIQKLQAWIACEGLHAPATNDEKAVWQEIKPYAEALLALNRRQFEVDRNMFRMPNSLSLLMTYNTWDPKIGYYSHVNLAECASVRARDKMVGRISSNYWYGPVIACASHHVAIGNAYWVYGRAALKYVSQFDKMQMSDLAQDVFERAIDHFSNIL